MTPRVELLDLGAIDYKECLERQRELFGELVAEKERGTGDPDKGGWLILCEHPHVYTLGKSGRADNLLVSEDFLREKGAALYRTDRGGDITYHGPGQMVGYPILDLEKTGMGLRGYIEAMEQSVIETAAGFGIEAGRSGGKTGRSEGRSGRSEGRSGRSGGKSGRSGGKTGVWIKDARGERKICAIGVRSSRFITMHGFALNVATDLRWYDYINPCGFVGGGVTSIEAETGQKVDPELVKHLLRDRISKNMNIEIRKG